LSKIDIPMLFLQGTADKLAQPELMAPLAASLGSLTTLHSIEAADHAFHVPARSGRTDAQVLHAALEYCVHWIAARC
jgi:hypothetical protein